MLKSSFLFGVAATIVLGFALDHPAAFCWMVVTLCSLLLVAVMIVLSEGSGDSGATIREFRIVQTESAIQPWHHSGEDASLAGKPGVDIRS